MQEKWAPDLTRPLSAQTPQQTKRFIQEKQFQQQHKFDTDEMLLNYYVNLAMALGHIPSKKETIGYIYLKQRLGSWPSISVKAGLKEPRNQRKERNRLRDEQNHARRLNYREKGESKPFTEEANDE